MSSTSYRRIWDVLPGWHPVDELIATRLPATIELVLVSAVLSLIVGIPMGVYTGLNRNSWLSRLLELIPDWNFLPTFVIGILLILIFGVWLQWLPTFGRGGVVDLSWWSTSFLTVDGWRSLIMPSVTLALFQLTAYHETRQGRDA